MATNKFVKQLWSWNLVFFEVVELSRHRARHMAIGEVVVLISLLD